MYIFGIDKIDLIFILPRGFSLFSSEGWIQRGQRINLFWVSDQRWIFFLEPFFKKFCYNKNLSHHSF